MSLSRASETYFRLWMGIRFFTSLFCRHLSSALEIIEGNGGCSVSSGNVETAMLVVLCRDGRWEFISVPWFCVCVLCCKIERVYVCSILLIWLRVQLEAIEVGLFALFFEHLSKYLASCDRIW